MKFKEFFARMAARIRAYDDTHNYTCDICAREVFAGERICESCRKTLPFIREPFCPLCGRKVAEEGACTECKRKRLPVDTARSVLLHEGEAARLILRFKRGGKYLYRTLAELMLPTLKEAFPTAEGLIYVPMTKKAEKKRGFNQSRLVAEELSRKTGLPLLDVVEKKRETPPQKSLGRDEREKNLEGAFHVTDEAEVKGKRLVIIDDILTTGATAGELAVVLKKAGAGEAFALTCTSVQNKTLFGDPPKREKKGKRVKS